MTTVRILGPGCANCRRLASLTEQALARLGVDAQIEKVTDPARIAGYGVLRTPALVVDEHVLMAGRIPALSSLEGALAQTIDGGGRIRTSVG